ncbi:hypothetical protein GQ607_000127 [Colletotrichum asianum]|uniref:Uncharacterized protein n=1 Tax=Colletotrichum asianum TaxID=702518 RepID=A0A8H3ZXQ4_9PEZI|nr:hypothetical protein GQ607_000127 [Colletotrichum asianum]
MQWLCFTSLSVGNIKNLHRRIGCWECWSKSWLASWLGLLCARWLLRPPLGRMGWLNRQSNAVCCRSV